MMRWIEWIQERHEGRPHGIIQSASIVQNNHLQNGNQDNDAFDYDEEKTTEHYVEDEDEEKEEEDNIEETLMAVLITNNWTGRKNEK